MYLDEGITNYIIIYSKDELSIKKIKKYLLKKYGKLDLKEEKNKNLIYIYQNSEKIIGIDIKSELKLIKNITNNVIILNKIESEETGDVELDYYFGSDIRHEYYENFDMYYGENFEYYDEDIKKNNSKCEIQKIANQFIRTLTTTEKEVLKFNGFKITNEVEYKKSDIFKLELDDDSKVIEYKNIMNGKPSKIFIFPENIEKLNCSLFITKVEKIIFNNNLKEIDHSGFMGLTKLVEIELPPSLEKIGVDLFLSDINLKTVDMSKCKIKKIGDIFAECKSLEKVYLPDSINEVEEFKNECIFKDCMNVTIYSNSEVIIDYCKKYNIECLPLNE